MSDRHPPRDPEDEAEKRDDALRLAELLDLRARAGSGELARVLRENPDAARNLTDELDVLEELRALAEDPPLPERLGDFDILGILDTGGMGIVCRARQRSLDRDAAVKILPAALASNPKARARFRRESLMAARLRHPNVVSVLAGGVAGGVPYYAMELAEGETLKTLGERCGSSSGGSLAEFRRHVLSELEASGSTWGDETERFPDDSRGRWSPAEPTEARSPHDSYCRWLARAFAGAAAGLDHAHSHDIVHRDIKPSNLIVSPDGDLRVLDFGIARVKGESGLTESGERVGTVLYMSPEQAADPPQPAEEASDIYSLGATLYEMLTLRPPLEGRHDLETLRKIRSEDPVPVRSLAPDVSADLEAVAMKCLRKKPTERFRSAAALREELVRIARGDPGETPRLTRANRIGYWLRRHRVGVAIGAFTVILAALGAAAGNQFWSLHRDRVQSEHEGHVIRGITELARVAMRPEATLERMAVDEILEDRKRRHPLRLELPFGDRFPILRSHPEIVEAGALEWPGADDPLERAVTSFRAAIALAPDRPIGHYFLGRTHLESGRAAAANSAASLALTKDRRFVPAQFLRHEALVRLQRTSAATAAAAELDRALAAGPAWLRHWVAGQRAMLDSRWEAAASALGAVSAQSIESGPKSDLDLLVLQSRVDYGRVQLERGDPVIASRAFAAAENLRDGWAEPVILGAKALFLLDRPTEADALLRRVAPDGSLPEGRDEIVRSVAWMLLNLGDVDRAVAWSERFSDDPSAQLERSRALFAAGRVEEALAVCREVRMSSPGLVGASLIEGHIRLASGELERATELYQSVARRDPRNVTALVGAGIARTRRGQFASGEKSLREAIRLDSSFVGARLSLARTLQARGNLDAAEAELERSLAIAPEQSVALNHLGTICEERGESHRAEGLYRRATSGAAPLSAAHYNLAWLLERRRMFAEAADEYRAAMAAGMEGELVRCNLGSCLRKARKKDEAISEYKSALERYPDSWLAWYRLGNVYERNPALRSERIAAYERTIELTENWCPPWKYLTETLYKADRRDEALERVHKVQSFAPDYDGVYHVYSKIHLQDRKPFGEVDTVAAQLRRLEKASLTDTHSRAITTLIEQDREHLAPRLVSYASVDAAIDAPRFPVAAHATCRYAIGDSVRDLENWIEPEYRDDDWATGSSPLAYPQCRTGGTDVSAMRGNSASLYARWRFTLDDASSREGYAVHFRMDDDYVACVNGREIVRSLESKPGTPVAPDAVAQYRHDLWYSDRLPIPPDWLRAGENVIAVRVLNAAPDDDDLYLDARVSVEISATERLADARAKLAAFRAAAREDDTPRVQYFEGRIAELESRWDAAAEAYADVLAADTAHVEPFLRLADALAQLGHHARAEAELRRALESGHSKRETVWDEWLAAAFNAEMDVERLAAEFPRGEVDLTELPHSARDAHWLLEQLAAGKSLRINCGARDNYRREDAIWSYDRFFRGGELDYVPDLNEPQIELEHRPIYQTERRFNEEGTRLPGYGIPVPPGEYRVTLHFIAGERALKWPRIFDVAVEDNREIESFEPAAHGFGKPIVRVIDTEVDDGFLDIVFFRAEGLERSIPCVSGIEVSRLDRVTDN